MNSTARTHQSQTIAAAMPITPICSTIPSSQDSSRRTASVEATDTYIVNFTSPAALSPLLSAPENGNATALKILWMSTSQITSCLVSGSSAYRLRKAGVSRRVRRFHAEEIRSVIRVSFLK